MKPTKKTLQAIKEIEKKVASVCNTNDGVVDEITGIVYPKKTTKVTTDDTNVIVSKENQEPNLPSSRQIEIKLSFGKSSPSLINQLEEKGFKLPKGVSEDAQTIRLDLLALKEVGILSNKQLWKCFKKLSKQISKMVVNSQIKEGEIATHIKTYTT
jgi:hypothetical protein